MKNKTKQKRTKKEPNQELDEFAEGYPVPEPQEKPKVVSLGKGSVAVVRDSIVYYISPNHHHPILL